MTTQYWLFKSEPSVYALSDLEREGVCHWEGVRNYQARNLLRDTIKLGDGVLFYHSREKPMAVMGVAEVVKEGYPDHTQFDKNATYYDPKADPTNPRWYMVDVAFKYAFKTPLTLETIKNIPALQEMVLVHRSRLSVQPVRANEWNIIIAQGGKAP